MKPKEFKEEMRLLVENAQYEDVKGWRRNEVHRNYRSVVNGREYKWSDIDPETFAREQIKKFNSQSYKLNSVNIRADISRAIERQRAMLFLWNHKELWGDIVKMYDKYKEYHDSMTLNPFLFTRASWDNKFANRPEIKELLKVKKKIETESYKLLGRKDFFFVYDSFPSNWLAMI